MSSADVEMLGGVPLKTELASDARLAMLLWGDAGCGKTTLAATAPGKKLFLQFDPDGVLSIATRNDIVLADFTGVKPETLVAEFKKDDPLGLEQMLRAHPDVETVVFDSMTAYAHIALQDAVKKAGGSKISLEQPGQNGYVWRNISVLRATTALLAVTARLNRNIILTTHENAPERDEQGNAVSITMALAERTANQINLRFNEVWWMQDTGKEHRIAVRPCRMRKPMKTRMWNADQPEFTWQYDAVTHTGAGIAEWFTAWKQGNGAKLPLPKQAVPTVQQRSK